MTRSRCARRRAELHDWDAAIERLQTRAAAKAQNVRAQAEREIAELRQARNRAAERLAELHTSSDEAWEEQKNRVAAELDEPRAEGPRGDGEVPLRRQT